jgi:hypothetical protein
MAPGNSRAQVCGNVSPAAEPPSRDVLADLDKGEFEQPSSRAKGHAQARPSLHAERVSGGASETASMPPPTCAHPVDTGGAQGGITHFGSLYWGKSLTL